MTAGRETERDGARPAVEMIRRGSVADVIIGDGTRHNKPPVG